VISDRWGIYATCVCPRIVVEVGSCWIVCPSDMYGIVYLGLTCHVAMYDAVCNLAVNNVMGAGILKLMPYANLNFKYPKRYSFRSCLNIHTVAVCLPCFSNRFCLYCWSVMYLFTLLKWLQIGVHFISLKFHPCLSLPLQLCLQLNWFWSSHLFSWATIDCFEVSTVLDCYDLEHYWLSRDQPDFCISVRCWWFSSSVCLNEHD